MSCLSSLSIGSLPIAGGAAAAGIAAAESAESAIAGIGTAPGAARHHVTEDQCGQEAAAPAAPVAAGSAGAEEIGQQADAAEDHGPGNGLGGSAVDTAGKLGGQGDALRLGHGSADGFGGGHEGLA